MNTPEFTPSLTAAEEAAIGSRAHAALEATTSGLPPDIAFRLRQSREQALARHMPRRRPVALLQWAGLPGAGNTNWLRDIVAPAMGIIMLALLATIAGQLAQEEDRDQAIDIDSALLTDDLPIDAYLDRGFGAWVDHQAGR